MLKLITHEIIIIFMIVFLVLGMLHQIIIGLLYQNMMKQVENMSSTKNKFLNQCKSQFSTYYQLHSGNVNVSIYVERFLSKLYMGKIKLIHLYHISGQCVLLFILFAGIGICKGIMEGLIVAEIMPYYLVSLLGLYGYFSLVSFVDLQGKKDNLKIAMIDFLENRMMNRLNYNMTDHIARGEWTPISNVASKQEWIASENVITTPMVQSSCSEKEEELITLLSEYFV